jgi:hypothetical protein
VAPPSAAAALLYPLDAAPHAVVAARCVAALRPLLPRPPLVWEGSMRPLRPLSPLAAWETAMRGISMWTRRLEPTRGVVGG